jgi:ATP-dependent Clp protease ATP-binding subunit ClpB
MNINKFTIKSQEAIQLSQQLAQELPATNRKRTYFFKAIFEIDENVAFILKKLNVNVRYFFKYWTAPFRVSKGEIVT